MRSNYKSIGKYIRQVKTRNSGLISKSPMGIKINKEFMPSVANTLGTDLTKYRVVSTNQFAYNPMHVGRDEVVPIALLKTEGKIIVSPAYVVFEIIHHEELDPEYLMMWCRRSEFDRNAWFTTDSSVRGGFSWDNLCEMEIPVPDIITQREIVKEYNTIVDRIKLNEQLNQKLEETAQALYKHWFVDFDFPDENGNPYKSSGGEMVYNDDLNQDIPVGWEVTLIKHFSDDMKSGGTPYRENSDYWNPKDYPWLKTGEISNKVLVEAEEYISLKGLENSAAKLLPINSVLVAMYGQGNTKGQVGLLRFEATTNQACCAIICDDDQKSSFLYYYFRVNRSEIVRLANGGAQPNLSKELISSLNIVKPADDIIIKHPLMNILNYREALFRETISLMRIENLLLSRMSKVESSKIELVV